MQTTFAKSAVARRWQLPMQLAQIKSFQTLIGLLSLTLSDLQEKRKTH
jgi:hypothetical protein